MATTSYRKARRTFIVIFIVSASLLLLMGLVGLFLIQPMSGAPPTSNERIVSIGAVVGVVTTCLTSIISFVGLISTLLLGWRKEVRDAKVSELERRRMEIEMEKQKLEVSKLKAEVENKQKSDTEPDKL